MRSAKLSVPFLPFKRAGLMVALSLVLQIAPARADFAVCNKTGHAALVAIGLQRSGTWTSAGWWRVAANSCTTIVRGKLTSRYYYLRSAHVGVEGNWDGNRLFCVRAKNFTIRGQKDCAKRGFAAAGFFEVDTGNELTWKQNLAD